MEKPEILLVEDNLADAQLLMDALAEDGWEHHLIRLPDGLEALDYLFRRGAYPKAVRPHLLLLDLNLPRVAGTEVLQAIQMDSGLADLPFFLLSGSEWDPFLGMAGLCPRERYLVKPSTFRGYLNLAANLKAQFVSGSPWAGVGR